MELTIAQRQPFAVLGILVHGKPTEIDFVQVWHEWMERYDEIAAFSVGASPLGIDYGCAETGALEYIAGMAVGTVAEVPGGLTLREVPGALDAVFECTLGTIHEVSDRINNEWLPASEYDRDRSVPGLEVYRPAGPDEDCPLSLHVPVKRKEVP